LVLLLGILAGHRALACCAIVVTADGRPVDGVSATIMVARNGPHVVLAIAVALPRTGTASAVLIPLPGPMTQPRLGAFDPAALDALLAETAPRVIPSADLDPCFQHAPAAPVAPMLANDAVTGQVGRPDFVLFTHADRDLVDWLGKRGLPSTGLAALQHNAAPVLALGVAPMSGPVAVASVQLRYDAPQVTMPALPAGADVTLLALTQGGRMEPIGLKNRRVPAGVDMPEFALDQFAHVYAAVLRHQAEGALLEFAGPAAAAGGKFVTRLQLRSPPDLTLGETSDVAPYRVEYRARIGWKGQYTLACSAGFDYRHAITARWQAENATLAALTGWRPEEIRKAMVDHWQRTREKPAD
jgi:hypothetical protein